MSIITPDTEINIHQNIPITDKQNIVFQNVEEQRAYFTRNTYKRIQDCTYVEKTGALKLELPYSDMYAFNYISWKNVAFENKWVYARVLSVDHDNNEIMTVTFAIDWWQTFMFNQTWYKSAIIRQHITTAEKEAIIANIYNVQNISEIWAPEPFSYAESEEKEYAHFDPTEVVFVPSKTQEDVQNWRREIVVVLSQEPVTGGEWGEASTSMGLSQNLVNACTIRNFAFDATGLQGLRDLLNDYTTNGLVSSILGIYILPHCFVEKTETISMYQRLTSIVPTYDGTLDPKLLRFPYSYLRVEDWSGNVKEYHWEKFPKHNGQPFVLFAFFTSLAGNPQMSMIPCGYNMGIDEIADYIDINTFEITDASLRFMELYNFKERMILNDWAQMAFNTDGYLTFYGEQQRMWLSENVMGKSGLELYNATNSGVQKALQLGSGIGALLQPSVMGARMSQMTYAQNMSQMMAPTGVNIDPMYQNARVAGAELGSILNGKGLQNMAAEQYLNSATAPDNIPSIYSAAPAVHAKDEYHAGANSSYDVYGVMKQPRLKFTKVSLKSEILNEYNQAIKYYGYSSLRYDVPNVIKYIANNVDCFVEGGCYCKTENATVITPSHVADQSIQAMFDGGHRFLKGSELSNA